MISAYICVGVRKGAQGFSAIARSVMISAKQPSKFTQVKRCFSAIARSVMISASDQPSQALNTQACFSAIARSVMISAS